MARNPQGGEQLPSTSAKSRASWYAPGLSDGLGDRLLMFDNSDAPSLELLRFHRDLANAPGFEAALREQVQRFGQFLHPAFAPIRSLQRLEPDDDLALVSNYSPGKRLSEVLRNARGAALATTLVRQLAPALAQFQQHCAGATHGLLGPDRIIVSPEGRLTIVEHVIGPALDVLNLGARQLSSVGVALPAGSADSAPPARLDATTDWYQLGLVALSVLIGRPVTEAERPHLEQLLDRPDVSAALRQWLDRALQISGPRIETPADGRAALEDLVQKAAARSPRKLEAVRRESEGTPLADFPTEQPRPAEQGRALGQPRAFEQPRVVAQEMSPEQPHPSPAVALSVVAGPFIDARSEPKRVRPDAPPILIRDAPAVRTLFGQSTESTHQSEFETRADRHVAAHENHQPHKRTPWRRRVRVGLVGVLALVAAFEAIVILGMILTSRRVVDGPVSVSQDAAGGQTLVSTAAPGSGPVRVTVAPDLQWARVISPWSAVGKTATPASATIRILSPIELKVVRDSKLLGSVPGPELNVPAGRHEIELVNEVLGYRLRQVIDVEAGGLATIQIALPQGSVTVDASPWAEVLVDGKAAGRTPIGPLSLAAGEHEITFRHPAGLSDRQRVTVKPQANTRVIGLLRKGPKAATR